MGEFAVYQGERVKIGTCEDMYYLRAADRFNVRGWDGDWGRVRFRFPWPDEDHIAPGGDFKDHMRSLALPGLTAPPELVDEHHWVQFCASVGFNVSLPCPESGTGVQDSNGGDYPLTVGRCARLHLCRKSTATNRSAQRLRNLSTR